MSQTKKVCKRCKVRRQVSAFRKSYSKYTKKNGEITTHMHLHQTCRLCESEQTAHRKIEKELMAKVGNHGTSVSLRTVLGALKRRMNETEDMTLRYAYASVGMELNNLLLRL